MRRTLDFRRIDLLLLGITVVLTLFGLAMIASVSVYESYRLTLRIYGEPYNSFYLWKSFLHMLGGFAVMALTTITPYHLWERHARTLFLCTLVLLVMVFIPVFQPPGAQTSYSWVYLRFFTIQPTEFLKLTFIFYLSVWLQKREQLIGTWKEGFLPFATLLVISTLLVAIQPDLGSFLVISTIACAMFFIAGGSIFHLLLGGGLAAVMGLPIILQEKYVRQRFTAFLFPDDPTIADKYGYQIKQALIAIGSGGFFGVGYGKSIQKFGYLPEVQADMIFSAMAEELGFLRVCIVLAMFSILVMRGYRIARAAPDRFGFLVASGISTWIAIQTIINISVNVGLFPITGLTLPFISAGGTSLITLLAGVGILLNISMHSTEEAALSRRTRKASSGSLLKTIFS